jgi:uncharacterized membrane protein
LTAPLPQLIIIIFMSMAPVIELKGSIIAGLAMGYPLWEVFIVAWVFSSLPSPFIMALLKPLMKRLRELPRVRAFIDRRISRSLEKADLIRKYSLAGLFFFVAIPLPGTGVWTGSIISSILGLDARRSAAVIALGNLVAGIAVLTVFNGLFGILR